MIASLVTRHSSRFCTLTPAHKPAVNGGEQSAASGVRPTLKLAGCSPTGASGARDVHSAQTVSLTTLTPTKKPSVGGGGSSVASAGCFSRVFADDPINAGAAASPIRTRISRPDEAGIIAAPRPVVIRQILALLGDDLPDARAHARYLETLSFADLNARREQLMRERRPARDIFGQVLADGHQKCGGGK